MAEEEEDAQDWEKIVNERLLAADEDDPAISAQIAVAAALMVVADKLERIRRLMMLRK